MGKENKISDKELIEYILGSIQYIEEWASGQTEESFRKDLLLFDAFLYRLFYIGLATSKISEDLHKWYYTPHPLDHKVNRKAAVRLKKYYPLK